MNQEEYEKEFGIPEARTKGNPEKTRDALEHALDIRKFEISLYWQRAAYFLALIAAAFAGYFAILSSENLKNKELLAFLISCIGLVFTWAWFQQVARVRPKAAPGVFDLELSHAYPLAFAPGARFALTRATKTVRFRPSIVNRIIGCACGAPFFPGDVKNRCATGAPYCAIQRSPRVRASRLPGLRDIHPRGILALYPRR